MPLSEPSSRNHKHTRQIFCQGFERDDGLWDIEATLTDDKTHSYVNHDRGEIPAGEPVHLMQVRIALDLDLVIHEIETCTDFTPFRLCQRAKTAMDGLVGLQIGPGWMREARSRVPVTEACTHLFELLGPLATTAYQTMHWAIEARDSKQKDRTPPKILDTCVSLQRHTTVVKAEWPEFAKDKTNKHEP
ncbi:MAG: DUF2889 domain-containing protein [Pseudomonadota bacterium]